MKSRPILFSGPMVRALLDGTKTQTRRIVKQVPHWQHCGKDIMEWELSGCYTDDQGQHWLDIQTDVDDSSHDQIACPYGQPGDRLWVQENHRLRSPIRETKSVECNYALDGVQKVIPLQSDEWAKMMDRQNQVGPDYGRIIPGRFMYRSLARITLEITSVRVERLQDISEEDALAEGIGKPIGGVFFNYLSLTPLPTGRESYRTLWESINGPDSWDANPFVWVIEFARL